MRPHGSDDATDAEHAADPPLVVLLGAMALDPRSGDPWLRNGITHLPVVVEGPRATVGPLVEPTLGGPCLWCLDLHRTDRDAAWPVVLAQVCGSPSDVVHREALPEADPALVQLVAGCIALFARRLPGSGSPPWEWRSSSASPGHGWTTAGGRRTPGARAATTRRRSRADLSPRTDVRAATTHWRHGSLESG